MVFETLKKLSLNELITTLHDLITSFSKGLDSLIQKNSELSINDIDELRNHIQARLEKGEERAENEKLQKLITLFKEDKRAFGLIRKDVDEWLEFLEAVELHIDKDRKYVGESEQKDLDSLKADLTHLQKALRRDEQL